MGTSKRGPKVGSLAARKGGETVLQRYGRDFYARIGKQGGRMVYQLHGTPHFASIGKKGGLATREKQGQAFYASIGRLGGQARRARVNGQRMASPFFGGETEKHEPEGRKGDSSVVEELVVRRTQYALTLEMLVQVLKRTRQRQTYQVTTTLPEELSPDRRKGGCQVQLVLDQGTIASCSLFRDRLLLADDEALTYIHTFLWTCDRLIWAVDTHAAPPGGSVQSSVVDRETFWAFSAPPYLTQTVTPELLHSLSRQQRSILLLVDGKRHLADFCSLLHLSVSQIQHVLDELKELQLIADGPSER